MKRSLPAALAAAVCLVALPAALAAQSTTQSSTTSSSTTTAQKPSSTNDDSTAASDASPKATPPAEQSSTTHGSVTVRGERIAYDATAGWLVLKDKDETPTTTMSYVAYVKSGADAATRPIMFLYNGGPGSSTIWLHMGAFGPQRVVTADHTHTAPAPYQLVNNDDSLLDVTDLVFVDAPGTGFSRLIDKDHGGAGTPKDFYGVDADGHAFAQFILRYLTKNSRWNSPKFLFGESYGTTRSAVVACDLETEDDLDLNGVILLSQILNYDISNDDDPEDNPGMDMTYELALPTYAATAWYHHKLSPMPADLPSFLKTVEAFAMSDYTKALQAGTTIDPADKQRVAGQLAQYTGVDAAYWEKADLRVGGGEFEHQLLGPDETTGRLDTRFAGPTLDPMGKEAEYDPQSSAISSAYVAVFNNYLRTTLNFKPDLPYLPENYSGDISQWDFLHAPPGSGQKLPQATNVMPDLAMAMKVNPDLKVELEAGYFDLATPFYAALYAMQHLPISPAIAKNITYNFYESGHMIYAHVEALKALHDNVAKFVASATHK